ncbi:hypothetical protein PR001_g907 [Phytophthora rubi]|uniref:Uncharacterized protein n=1 Tax=Phytophthora rubi TaxID=129364 RepID=A0A6A3NPP8_9STRA|nr:hypothetical protein PR002_g1081 [Phytophthora rubi]KAE9052031.1 hypothetical protein PR001_g907 [Phytophthora rubi]
MELTPSKRKQYIAQFTVWDAEGKKGFASKVSLRFRPGGLYESRQVDGVVFYADIPSGRVPRRSEQSCRSATSAELAQVSPRESGAKVSCDRPTWASTWMTLVNSTATAVMTWVPQRM